MKFFEKNTICGNKGVTASVECHYIIRSQVRIELKKSILAFSIMKLGKEGTHLLIVNYQE
jgi:hypothetical protein